MHAKGIADTFFFTLGFQGNLRNIFRTNIADLVNLFVSLTS